MLILQPFREKRRQGDLRDTLKTQAHQPQAHDDRRRFYLALLIGRPRSTLRYAISLRRDRASNISSPAVPSHADRSPVHQSAAAEPSCAHCRECAWPAMRMTIGPALIAPSMARLIDLGMSVSLPIFIQ